MAIGPCTFPTGSSSRLKVTAVAPGTINTERVKRLPEEPGGPEYLEVIKAGHPMGRLGEPSEVAEAILFLASDQASFITGRYCLSMGAFSRGKAFASTAALCRF